jgi:DsbC/DsbD-like thiol-disulfide interchange protein
MDRRSFLIAAGALPFCNAALSADDPWTARFFDGGFDGRDYWAGFAIEMSGGWKTYWRVPGSGGVPPEVQVTGANLKEAEFLYPLPQRFRDPDGESIGYKKTVVFPIRLTPKSVATLLRAEFTAFFGVCDVVCIPARREGAISFASDARTTPDAVLLASWRQRVPSVSTTGPVLSAEATSTDGKPALVVTLAAPVEEIFVVGPERYYFQAPAIEENRATLPIAGASAATEIKGQKISLTTVSSGVGLEQVVTVL